MRRCLAALGLLLILTCAYSAEGDWPQWRGPNRDGLSLDTGLLKQWPKDGPSLAWKATGLGRGFSSISISNGRIYTMGDRESACFLIALSVEDGKELWSTRVGATGSPGGYEGPRCTPTVDGNLVYAVGQNGDLVCVEATSGSERWRKSLEKDFKGRKGDGWGYSESPLIDGDKLICTPGGNEATMAALNKQTGEVIWKAAIPGGYGAGHASPMLAVVGGIRHYVQLTAGGVVGVSAKDGKLLWEYGKGKIAPNTANIPTCIVKGNLVFCTAGYGKGGELLRLSPSSGGVKADEVYFKQELTNKHGGVVLVGEHLYGDRDDSGRPWCAELKSGKIEWQRDPSATPKKPEAGKARGRGRNSAAVTYADGHLYIRYQNGIMTLVEATPKGYTEKGAFEIPRDDQAPSWPHPVVAGGKLYLREQETLLCYDVKAR